MKGRCEGCGAEAHTTLSQWDERLCPACMTRFALAYGASDHLETLLREAMREWLNTWGDYSYIVSPLADEAAVLCREAAPALIAERTGKRRMKPRKVA